MLIKKASFIKSSQGLSDCPAEEKFEFAFTGRSNVGKSSLINMLVGQKKLAKTSGTPGKTQLINHFNIDDQWYLVDLPGYGYAKVSKKARSSFNKMIKSYLAERSVLACVFVLIDVRHEPQTSDLNFLRWLGEKEIPFQIVFTKSDKLKETTLAENVALYKRRLLEDWAYLPDVHITSSVTTRGKDELLGYIHKTNEFLINKTDVIGGKG